MRAYQETYPGREADTPKYTREGFSGLGRLEGRGESRDKGRHHVVRAGCVVYCKPQVAEGYIVIIHSYV